MLIDTHAHITSKQLSPFLEEILEKHKLGQPEYIFEAGSNVEDVEKILNIIEKDKIFAYIGIHPHYAAETDNYKCIIDAAKNNKKIIGIGEIGLDYHYDFAPRELQQKVFREQIELADNLNLPIILHIREAYKDSIDILKDMKSYLKRGIYLHCYGGSKELVSEYKKLGAIFGFTGVITFKNANKAETIKEVGLDYILSETDSPYLTPHPFRGKINKPEYVEYILEKYVEIFGEEKILIEEKIKNNVNRFFGEIIK